MLIFDQIFIYMRIVQRLGLFLFLFAGVTNAFGQQSPKCGFDYTIKAVTDKYPSFADTLNAIKNPDVSRAAGKTSAGNEVPVVPVVFHVILNKSQMVSIGDTAGIIQRINAQLDVLNRDFNAMNADSVKIPGGFKGLYGNAGIRFGLAHTAPDGSATPGYEIITTTKNGFNIENEGGSGYGFSGAKYFQYGGADAWDTESYLNIWIINPLEDGTVTNVLGLAIPPYLATDEYGISPVEMGIAVHYAAFGNRRHLLENYIKGSDMGRTLVHEVAHFFDLLHIWGDDDGACPYNGGSDDGIDDTPLQSTSSSGCLKYPRFDACTRTGDGIMFMNYMDYSSDSCLLLFTHGQVAKMQAALQPGARAFGLTQQPWLLSYPDPANPPALNDFTVYPNPADDVLNIVFRKQAQGLGYIHLVDIMGRVIDIREYDRESSFYSFSVANLRAGLYFVILHFDAGREVRKVLVR